MWKGKQQQDRICIFKTTIFWGKTKQRSPWCPVGGAVDWFAEVIWLFGVVPCHVCGSIICLLPSVILQKVFSNIRYFIL